MRMCNGMAILIIGFGLLLIETPVHALFTTLMPLKTVLEQSNFIVTAKVESVDADKPALVIAVDEDLKGKLPSRKLPVLLKGDAEAKKKKHVPQILKRVAPKLPLILFVIQKDKKNYAALAYTNGTWFQILGSESDGAVRWSFTHGEPYLRKTFKGTTAELKQIVIDGLSGKKDPPKPDTKEKPGFGPGVPAEKKSEGRGPAAGSALFAVIPTVLVGGPLAILAMLFPAVFGGLMLVLRRWLAALSVLSINSTLYVTQDLCRRWLVGSWWGTPSALWLTMTIVTLIGILWAWRRHLIYQPAALTKEDSTLLARQAGSSEITTTPAPVMAPARKAEGGWSEVIVLGILGALCSAAVIFSLRRSPGQLDLLGKLLVMFAAGLWVATLHALYQRWIATHSGTIKQGLPGEGVLLWTMMLVSVAYSPANRPRELPGQSAGISLVNRPRELSGESEERQHRVAWRFQPKVERCWIASSPRVDGERVYIGVVLPSAFGSSGAVYCVDRSTGKEIWMFNDGGGMKDVFSSPCITEGRVYIGEGFHQHADCKLYCLDAATGKKQWDFATTSHTESTPCVVAGKVYFGAGDDGLYCLEAATGKKIWHLPGLHVDANPLVIDNRLYGGSGVGDSYKETQLFCLNADTGEVHWRMPVDLPVWGMPAIQGEYLYAGIGNGNFLASADQLENPAKPAGAVLCLERATGKRIWRYDVPDGVLAKVCLDDELLWFAGRGGHCYCLDRREGGLRWKTDLGSPVVASPVLAGRGERKGLYIASSGGRVSRLDPRAGKIDWTFDVANDAEQPAMLFSSPLVQVHEDRSGESRLIWFGCGLSEFTRGILYCLEERIIEKN